MSVNQQTVEDTKAQIRGLVNEIATLSKSGATAEEFYPELLSRIVTALAAVGGAVWLLDDDQQLRLQYQINAEPSILADDTEDASRHQRLIRRAAASGQSVLVPPYSGTTDGEAEGNPTRHLLVLGALKHEGQHDGLIEIFQRPDTAPETQKGYLRFLQNMCDLAAEWLRSQKLRDLGDRQTLWQQSDSFARAAHESLDLKETAHIVANEGRRLIGCDRVSVAIKRGRRCVVEAMSGQDTIENRSNIVTALNNLATKVATAGEPLWHDGTTEDLPPQIEEALEEYVDESYGRQIAVLPLREPQRKYGGNEEGAAGEIDRDDAHRGEIIGALIVEQIQSDIPNAIFRSRCDLVYEHGTRALANSQSYSTLFLMPVWRMLGRASWVLRARTLPKTIAVLVALVALGLFLTFFKIDFDLEAEGTIIPEIRRQVFAPIDGEVDEVFVAHNRKVRAGDPLVRLRNRPLEIELADLYGKLKTTLAEQRTNKAKLIYETQMQESQRRELEGRSAELRSRIAGFETTIELTEARAEQLVIRAPIDGTVVTWELEKTLRSRPISTGQVLLEIADLDSQAMYLELELPDKRQGHLDRYCDTTGTEVLDVEYILASQTGETLHGKLSRDQISLRAEPHPEHGSVIKMRASLDAGELAAAGFDPAAGTKVTADIKCGQAASGFVLFHEPYEWLCHFLF